MGREPALRGAALLWTGAHCRRLCCCTNISKGHGLANRNWTRDCGRQVLEERAGFSSWDRRPAGQTLCGRCPLLLLLLQLACIRWTVLYHV